MNHAELRNLTLFARTAYAIMCFERYTGFVYKGIDFKPAAELMWHLIDGSIPTEQAAGTYLDIIPEHLFAYKTYEAYQSAGHDRLTKEQFRIQRRTLDPDDWNLNSMMKQIYQMLMKFDGTEVPPHAPDTLPFLEKITAMLTVRSIVLPDPELLQQYAFNEGELPEGQPFDWRGGPVDPAPLSLLGLTGSANNAHVRSAAAESAVTHVRNSGPNICMTSDSGPNRYGHPLSYIKDIDRDILEGFEAPVRPIVEANDCIWELLEQPEGYIITRCINGAKLKEITIPDEFNGKPIIAVEDNAFSKSPKFSCSFIETLNMPDSIRQIGNGFFKSCTGLRYITLPAELERLGNEAFRGASNLESLTIGNHCRIIGDYFCADAVSLRSVTIGTGIEYMGEYTFYNTPLMTEFRCEGMLTELGYGSFWMNKWADSIIFNPTTEMLRFCKDGALLYRYVKRTPPPRLFMDEGIRYVFDFAFGGDAWHYGDGITDIYLPGAEKIGVNAFKKTPHATVHLNASKMEATYGSDYAFTLAKLCEPAKVVFDQ